MRTPSRVAPFWEPIGVSEGTRSAHSVAFRINNAGQVVGRSPAPTGQRAFLWTAGGGMQNLGDLRKNPISAPLTALTMRAG